MSSVASGIDSVLVENRLFRPPHPADAGVPKWLIESMDRYRTLHRQSLEDPSGFWEAQARTLHWTKPWARVLDWTPPDAKWFLHGQLNACDNCVDRQVKTGHGDQTAIIWEGEPVSSKGPEIRRLTYADLLRDTSKFANILRSLGVKKGDVVTLYMPMVPELAIAMLACARIGAAHSVIFGGFAPTAIVERVTDAKSKVIITADGGYRRGEIVPLKKNVDEACDQLAAAHHPIEHVVVLRRTGRSVDWSQGRDHWWHEHMAKAADLCPCQPMDSEDMLFLLYTSGSTGKPKGILHTTGGYMVYTTMTARMVFNLLPTRDRSSGAPPTSGG
jgi:acetyl-CoA synthetase